MIDILVSIAMVCAVAFVAGWLFSPSLRVWAERPKHRFQAHLRHFDQTGRTPKS